MQGWQTTRVFPSTDLAGSGLRPCRLPSVFLSMRLIWVIPPLFGARAVRNIHFLECCALAAAGTCSIIVPVSFRAAVHILSLMRNFLKKSAAVDVQPSRPEVGRHQRASVNSASRVDGRASVAHMRESLAAFPNRHWFCRAGCSGEVRCIR